MRWKRSAEKGETKVRSREEGLEAGALRDRVRADLETRGVIGDRVPILVEVVVARLLEAGADDYLALLDGIAISEGTVCEEDQALDEARRDLRQLERLMSGFSGELAKLDETLEVLAAYLRRMRGTAAEEEDPILH